MTSYEPFVNYERGICECRDCHGLGEILDVDGPDGYYDAVCEGCCGQGWVPIGDLSAAINDAP